MTQEELQKIRKKIKNGIPEGEMKNQLKEEGYSAEDIQKIFEPHKYDMRTWYFISGILVFIFAVYCFSRTGMVSLLLFGLDALLFYEYYKERLKHQ